MEAKLLHPLNADLFIEVIPFEIMTFVSVLQSENMATDMLVIPPVIVASDNLAHAENAEFPTFVTFIGTTIFVRPDHRKALSWIITTLRGILIDVRLLQDENALPSITATLFGMTTFVRLLHDMKARLPIFVTPLGIEISFNSSHILNEAL